MALATKRQPGSGAGRTGGAKSSCVALDLGAHYVRAVEIEWTGGENEGRIAKRGYAPLPPNIWNDLQGSGLAIAGAIRDALASGNIAAKRVVVSLPRRLVTLRFARLPKAPPEQLRGMVTFEAQQYVLFPLEEVTLDYCIVPEQEGALAPGEEEMATLLLAAARRSLISDLMEIFDRLSLEIERLTVSALALAEHAHFALGTTALVDVDSGEMDVAIVSDGRLLFTRASALEQEGVDPLVRNKRLADEVARSFAAYQNEFRHLLPAHVYLSGVDARDAQMTLDILSQVLEMPVGLLPARLAPGAEAGIQPYVTAIGAALQTRPDSIGAINLVPNERAEKKAQAAQSRRKILYSACIAGAVLLGAVYAWNQWQTQQKERQATIRVNNDLREITKRMDGEKRVYDQNLALVKDLEGMLDRRRPSVDVLYALGRAMPKTADIWLTQMTFDREGGLTLRGESKSETAATDLVIALQGSTAFTQVRLGYLGDSQTSESSTPNAEPIAPAPTNTAPAPNNNPPIQPLPGMNAQPGTPPGAPPNAPNPAPGNAAPNPAAPATNAAGTRAPVLAPGANRGRAARRTAARTTFIITCKVNRRALTLIPQEDIAKVAPPKTGAKALTVKKSATTTDAIEAEEGDDQGD